MTYQALSPMYVFTVVAHSCKFCSTFCSQSSELGLSQWKQLCGTHSLFVSAKSVGNTITFWHYLKTHLFVLTYLPWLLSLVIHLLLTWYCKQIADCITLWLWCTAELRFSRIWSNRSFSYCMEINCTMIGWLRHHTNNTAWLTGSGLASKRQ